MNRFYAEALRAGCVARAAEESRGRTFPIR